MASLAPLVFVLVTSMLTSLSAASEAAVAGLLVSYWILTYLDGPASYVAISERHVEVANAFRRYLVPRSLVDSFEDVLGGLGLELVLRGQPPIRVLAAELPVSPGNAGSGRHYRVKARRLNEALAATGAAEVAGTVERRIRPVNVLLPFVPVALLVVFLVVKPS